MKPPRDWPWKADQWVDLDDFPQDDSFVALARTFLLEMQEDFAKDSAALNLVREDIALGLFFDYSLNFEARPMGAGGFAIGIDAAAPFQLMDVFKRLVIGTTVLPQVGQSIERSSQLALIRHEGPELGSRQIRSGCERAPELKSPQDWAVWTFLVRAALSFTYFHEIGHILAGHVTGVIAPDSRARRARELQADHSGSLAALARLGALELDDAIAAERYYLWGFAISTLFGLIETFTADDRAHRGYPDAAFDGGDPYPRGGLRGFWRCQAPTVVNLDWRDECGRLVKERTEAGWDSACQAWRSIGWGHIDGPSDVEIREIASLLAPGQDVVQ